MTVLAVMGVMKPTTTTDNVRHEPSKRSGSPTHVSDIGDECTGLITPNGVEVPLTTLDQKRRKWWRIALTILGFITTWHVDTVCWLCDGSIGIDLVRLQTFEALVVPKSPEMMYSDCLKTLVATCQAVSRRLSCSRGNRCHRPASVENFMGADLSCRFLLTALPSVYNKWIFFPDDFAFLYPLYVTSLPHAHPIHLCQ